MYRGFLDLSPLIYLLVSTYAYPFFPTMIYVLYTTPFSSYRRCAQSLKRFLNHTIRNLDVFCCIFRRAIFQVSLCFPASISVALLSRIFTWSSLLMCHPPESLAISMSFFECYILVLWCVMSCKLLSLGTSKLREKQIYTTHVSVFACNMKVQSFQVDRLPLMYTFTVCHGASQLLSAANPKVLPNRNSSDPSRKEIAILSNKWHCDCHLCLS